MSSNYRRNKAFIDKYRKELRAMLNDISEIDKRVLNKAVSIGLADAKRNTNAPTGFMRKSWSATPAIKTSGGIEKRIVNTAYYAPYVNYGHRIVTGDGRTVGWAPGQFMLEKAVNKVDKALESEFKKEVERVKRKHDK